MAAHGHVNGWREAQWEGWSEAEGFGGHSLQPDGYCNSNGCACEVHYRTHLRRNSFIPAAKVKSQCRVDVM